MQDAQVEDDEKDFEKILGGETKVYFWNTNKPRPVFVRFSVARIYDIEQIKGTFSASLNCIYNWPLTKKEYDHYLEHGKSLGKDTEDVIMGIVTLWKDHKDDQTEFGQLARQHLTERDSRTHRSGHSLTNLPVLFNDPSDRSAVRPSLVGRRTQTVDTAGTGETGATAQTGHTRIATYLGENYEPLWEPKPQLRNLLSGGKTEGEYHRNPNTKTVYSCSIAQLKTTAEPLPGVAKPIYRAPSSMMSVETPTGESRETPQIPGQKQDYYVMSFRKNYDGVFSETQELESFPFDCQDMSIQIEENKSICQHKNNPSCGDCFYCADDTVAYGKSQGDNFGKISKGMSNVIGWEFESALCEFTKTDIAQSRKKKQYARFVLRIKLARKYNAIIAQLIIPISIIWLMMLATYAIPPYRYAGFGAEMMGGAVVNDRLAFLGTLLLTQIAFYPVVAEKIPPLPYITIIEIYLLTSLGFLAVNTLVAGVIPTMVYRWKEMPINGLEMDDPLQEYNWRQVMDVDFNLVEPDKAGIPYERKDQPSAWNPLMDMEIGALSRAIPDDKNYCWMIGRPEFVSELNAARKRHLWGSCAGNFQTVAYLDYAWFYILLTLTLGAQLYFVLRFRFLCKKEKKKLTGNSSWMEKRGVEKGQGVMLMGWYSTREDGSIHEKVDKETKKEISSDPLTVYKILQIDPSKQRKAGF